MCKKYSDGKDYKVIAFFQSRFFNDEERGIMKQFVEQGRLHRCKIVFFSSLTKMEADDSVDTGEHRVFELAEISRFDAVVLMAQSFSWQDVILEMVQRAKEAGVPVLTVDGPIKGCTNLTMSYEQTFREVVVHMVEHHGYKVINFMGGMPGNSFSDARLQVFRNVLEENGIPYEPERVYYGYFWEDPTRKALKKMLQDIENGQPMPEAIICANDAMALTVCKVLQEKGYRVPEDIAVSGFDGIELEKFNRPRLTTGVYNVEGVVEKLFEIICAETRSETDAEIPIYNKFRIGRSCGCHGVETEPSTAEMEHIKGELHQLIRYHSRVNQMVADYGNIRDFSAVVRAVPEFMREINYKEFWFCARESFFEESEDRITLPSIDGQNTDKDRSYVVHYRKKSPDQKELPEISFWIPGDRRELLPDLDQVFERADHLLVLTIHNSNEIMGYSVLHYDQKDFWRNAYAVFITSFRHLLEQQKIQMHMRKLYLYDLLTGLYNRTGFYEKIGDLLKTSEEEELTIISMDMDGLKAINDTYGHAEGDLALSMFGALIRKSVDAEIAARIGGDEFLIALIGNENTVRSAEIVKRIEQNVSEYNRNKGQKYELGVSIGAYTGYVKNHTLDFFLREADERMYAQKHERKWALQVREDVGQEEQKND